VLNHYTSAINPQDPVLNKNDAIVVKELGLPDDIQREELQTESINVGVGCGHHIPVLLNGKVCSTAVNQSQNDVIKSNLSVVNEVSVNNFLSTGNLWLQTSNKTKSRVVILSDSHLEQLVASNQEL
jgi:hypothetical protein